LICFLFYYLNFEKKLLFLGLVPPLFSPKFPKFIPPNPPLIPPKLGKNGFELPPLVAPPLIIGLGFGFGLTLTAGLNGLTGLNGFKVL